MSVLLYALGGLALMAGALAIAFGIPVKEFSFGDTLIVAGTVSFTGGLILIALAAAVSQLARIADLLGARPLARSGRPLETLAPARIPFPPRQKSELPREPVSELPPFVAAPIEQPPAVEPEHEDDRAAPSLRNPDVPMMADAETEEAPLSPLRPPPGASPPRPAFKFPEPPKPSAPPEQRAPASFEPPWKSKSPSRPSQPSYFDAMWKDEHAPAAAAEPPRSRAESIPRAPTIPEPAPQSEPEQPEAEEARAVAILKSGVVDGMGYTLYVDGSIEAELPDGTLRFASINELRAHLERNS